MSNTNKNLFRVISLLVLMVSFIPISQPAQAATALPPVDMFQLPWDQGVAWVAIDGFDDGSKRLPGSPHNYHNGGAVDFAPRPVMFKGEDTSNFWVTAAANGTIVEISKCHMKIAHANGWITEYQHLANIQVKLGDVVARNQRLAVIANASSQPVCAGSEPPDIPHLHFTLRPNMVGATFAGWEFKYNKFWNTTTFAKDGKIVTLYKPLLNLLTAPTPTPTLTAQPSFTPTPATSQATVTPGGPTNTPDPFATATPTALGQNTNTPDPLASATPTPFGQFTNTPDPFASGTPTPFDTNTPDPSQFTQTPDVNATATTIAERTATAIAAGPSVSTTVNPTTIDIGAMTLATVSLNNVPATGFTSAEFTCALDPNLVESSNITITALFGTDAASVVNGPQNGTFIVAIAGTNGNKVTTSGPAFTFSMKGLQVGLATINCTARVSTGSNSLTSLPSSGDVLFILTNSPTPTASFTPNPAFTATPTQTPSVNGWLTFTNSTFGFQFQYPPQGQIQAGSNDGDTIIRNLPIIQPGTNLSEKYVEVAAGAPATECKSLFPTQDPGVTVTINGINFLKQTGLEGAAGNLYQWVAFSTLRNGVCVSVNFVLHSQNPAVFPTPPPTYDFATEAAIFDQIIGTYMWLAVAPTATPTVVVPPATPTGTLPSATPVITDTPVASPTQAPPTSTPLASPTASSTSIPVSSPTPTPLPAGTLNGQVLAAKPVTITVSNLDSTPVISIPANVDGTFNFTVPPGTYRILAEASGYLSAQGTFTVAAGGTTTLPTISLPAGDIDGNSVIDQLDALTIGMNYNSATPAAADLNNDGVINVLDLEALAKNYRKTGPAVWQ